MAGKAKSRHIHKRDHSNVVGPGNCLSQSAKRDRDEFELNSDRRPPGLDRSRNAWQLVQKDDQLLPSFAPQTCEPTECPSSCAT